MIIGKIINHCVNVRIYLLIIHINIFIAYFDPDIHNDYDPCSKLDIANISKCENYLNFITEKIFFTKNIIFAYMFINFVNMVLKVFVHSECLMCKSCCFDENQNQNSNDFNNHQHTPKILLESFMMVIFSLLSLLNNPSWYYMIDSSTELKELEMKKYIYLLILYYFSDFLAFILLICVIILSLKDIFYNSKINKFVNKCEKTAFIDIDMEKNMD